MNVREFVDCVHGVCLDEACVWKWERY